MSNTPLITDRRSKNKDGDHFVYENIEYNIH